MTRIGKTTIIDVVSKKYDEAYKRQAVKMALQGGKTVKQGG
jgi:hypothetical protein